MTLAQSRHFILSLFRKSRKLVGFKLREMNLGYIYCPYIPLITTLMPPAELEEVRRQLADQDREVQEHLEASRNVDLRVQ